MKPQAWSSDLQRLAIDCVVKQTEVLKEVNVTGVITNTDCYFCRLLRHTWIRAGTTLQEIFPNAEFF
jgi:hypothetical protein